MGVVIQDLFGGQINEKRWPRTKGEEASGLIRRLEMAQWPCDGTLRSDIIEFLNSKRQGQESNIGGEQQERHIRSLFKDRSVPVIKFKAVRDLLNSKVVMMRVPYQNIYGHRAHSEFVYRDHARDIGVRIESRYQEVSGSVDEKFPFMLNNAVHCYPEKNIWFVVGGKGARKGAIEYLKSEARKASSGSLKVIRVIHISDINCSIKNLVERGLA